MRDYAKNACLLSRQALDERINTTLVSVQYSGFQNKGKQTVSKTLAHGKKTSYSNPCQAFLQPQCPTQKRQRQPGNRNTEPEWEHLMCQSFKTTWKEIKLV